MIGGLHCEGHQSSDVTLPTLVLNQIGYRLQCEGFILQLVTYLIQRNVRFIVSFLLITPHVHWSTFFKDQCDKCYLLTTFTVLYFFTLVELLKIGPCFLYVFYIFCRVHVYPIRSNSHFWYKFCPYVFTFFTTSLLL